MSADARTRFDLVEDHWPQLLAVDERVLREAVRKAAHRRLVRTLALALLGLVAAAALAAAATWIFGSVAPHEFASLESTGRGSLTPAGTRLVRLRVADPEGGPPWGLRELKTSRNRTCFQVGRVVRGELVALGVAGAFGNDGRAHRLPVETEGCGSTGGRFGAVSQVVTADGSVGSPGCRVEGERDARRALPRCAQADRRSILFGAVGSKTTTMSFVLGSIRINEDAPGGVFLFVLSGAVDVGNARLLMGDREGMKCELDNPAATPEQSRNHYKSPLGQRCDGGALR